MSENHAATTSAKTARAGRKRSYEYSSDEEEDDVEWIKLYKGDCYDDPLWLSGCETAAPSAVLASSPTRTTATCLVEFFLSFKLRVYCILSVSLATLVNIMTIVWYCK